jgi:hypothetical protein
MQLHYSDTCNKIYNISGLYNRSVVLHTLTCMPNSIFFAVVTALGAVWFVAKCATVCLRLVVRIEELTLGRKVWQSVAI